MCFGNHISRYKIAKEIHSQFNFWYIKHFITEVLLKLLCELWIHNRQSPTTECLKCKRHRKVRAMRKMEYSPTSMFLLPHGPMCTRKQRLTAERILDGVPRVSPSLTTWFLYLIISDVSSQLTGWPIWVHACMPKRNLSISGHFGKLSANFLVWIITIKTINLAPNEWIFISF